MWGVEGGARGLGKPTLATFTTKTSHFFHVRVRGLSKNFSILAAASAASRRRQNPANFEI